MKFRIQVVRVADDGAERMKEVMEFERQELAMETLGMSLAEGKAVLKGVQELWPNSRSRSFCNESGLAGIAPGIYRAKAPVRLQCGRCSGQCGCRTHAGISVTVSRAGKGPFDRYKAGCAGKPVLSCCIWKCGGLH